MHADDTSLRTYPRVGATAAAVFFAICAATYVVNAADRLIFPIVVRPVAAEYGFSLSQGGALATIYLMGLGLGGIGTGYVLDRISRKSAIIAGIVLYSLFTLFTVTAFGFFDMALYRTLTGLGEGVQSVAFVIAVGAYYPRARTFAIALVQCALGFGQFFGPRAGAALIQASGDWRMPFYAFGIAGLIGAAAVIFVDKGFTEQKDSAASQAAAGLGDDAHMPSALWNRNVICVLLVVLIRSFPFFGFLGLYTAFLTGELHFTLPTAAVALSLFGLGPFFSPLAGYVADRVNQKLFQIVSLAVMAVAGYLIFNVAKTPLEHDALALLEGIAGAFAYVNGYSLAQRSVKSATIARVSGWYYAASTFPAALTGFLFAKLIEIFGWGTAATLFMSLLLLVPVAISLLIDTRFITGRGRRTMDGTRVWS
ncbi:MAG TPA: MFS transporter [Micropepsaceae bacterium]|nr:MFS transporter [Micropepsaceae bacterium]